MPIHLEALPVSSHGPTAGTFQQLLLLAMLLRRPAGRFDLSALVSSIRTQFDVPEAELRECFWRLAASGIVEVDSIQGISENGGAPPWEEHVYNLTDTGKQFARAQMEQLAAILRFAGHEVPEL